jgi:hypothetical protein
METAPSVSEKNILFEKTKTDSTPMQRGDIQLPSSSLNGGCRQQKIKANCCFGNRTGPKRRIQSAQREYQNIIDFNGREPKSATSK